MRMKNRHVQDQVQGIPCLPNSNRAHHGRTLPCSSYGGPPTKNLQLRLPRLTTSAPSSGTRTAPCDDTSDEMIRGRERSVELQCANCKHTSMVAYDEQMIGPDREGSNIEVNIDGNVVDVTLNVATSDEHVKPILASRLMGKIDRMESDLTIFSFELGLAFFLLTVAFLLLLYHGLKINKLQHSRTTATVLSGNVGTIHDVAGKYNPSHELVMSRPVPSQLHQEVVRVLRIAQYETFAALLDNMTESVVRDGVTVFAPSDEALCDFQVKNADSEIQLEDFVRFHVIKDTMPFSNLLRLEVGNRLTTGVLNITILVTNATAGAFQVDDAEIVDADLYKDATIAVHGIDAVFNTSKIVGLGDPAMAASSLIPFLILSSMNNGIVSSGFKTPIAAMGVQLGTRVLVSFTLLVLIYLTAQGW